MKKQNAIVSTNSVDPYHWGSESLGWHLLDSEALSIIEECVPPGDCEQRHFHQYSQQFFYVLQGIATIEMEGRLLSLRQGEGVHVPARCAHQLFNHEQEDLRFLVISSPKSHGDRVLAEAGE